MEPPSAFEHLEMSPLQHHPHKLRITRLGDANAGVICELLECAIEVVNTAFRRKGHDVN
jgi:hypothetical protein